METNGKIKLSRRDFLKVAAGLSLTPLVEKISPEKLRGRNLGGSLPNIIILIFDALSAYHLSLYGYPRNTSPNFERFAEKATVYHNHHSPANFTTPSTASLFTSTYPWQHRAYTLKGSIRPHVVPNNIFRLLRDKYYTAAFTQNIYADKLLFQFDQYLDRHQSTDSFNFIGNSIYNILPSEEAIAGFRSFDTFLIKRRPPRGSLLMSILYDFTHLLRYRLAFRDLTDLYPIGMPGINSSYAHFTLDQVMEGVMSLLEELPAPFFSYIHLMPPHSPYRPNSHFQKMFNDGWEPLPKERHPLGDGHQVNYPGKRQTYDEFIANLDYEFGRLLDYLEDIGLLGSSYLILTSDHGEIFERGEDGHGTSFLFEPLLRVPLVISSPGQEARKDIHAQTSSVDLLPTLLHIAGLPIPGSVEGQILPFQDGNGDPERNIWALEASSNSTFGPMHEASLALIKGTQKLVYYQGYENYKDNYELYNLENDPDELVDRYTSDPRSGEMQEILDQKFREIIQPTTE
ncbi:sulfatase-like hydrolase/transferase [Chloroflexota bacterium]